MTFRITTVVVGAALFVSACSKDPEEAGALSNPPGDGGFSGDLIAQPPVESGPLPSTPAYFQQTIGDRVFFPVDQSTLTEAARSTLEGQARWLLSNSDFQAVIEGHADEQGTREYYLALGARRANAVLEYLVSRGVPSSRFKIVSFGKERPVEICSDEACYAKNRRAVTVIAAGGLTG